MEFEAIFQALMTDEKAAQVLLGDDFAAAFAKAKSLEAGITEDQFRAFIAERKQNRANMAEYAKFALKAKNDAAFADKVADSTPEEAYELAKDVMNLDKETFIKYLSTMNVLGKAYEQQEGEIDDEALAAVAGGAGVGDKMKQVGKNWLKFNKEFFVDTAEDGIRGMGKFFSGDVDGAIDHGKKVFTKRWEAYKNFWGSIF